MANFAVKQFVVGPVCTNCYFAINEKSKEMFVVDPGDQADLLAKQIEGLGVKPVAVLLTHGHFDHAGAAEALKEKYGIPVYVHEAEKETMEDPNRNLSGSMMGNPEKYSADYFVKDGEELEIAGMKVQVLFTPGHTAGGACYYLPNEMAVFSGDTLFCESIGRTDFPGGSASTLIRSIREKLLPLADFIKVYPGHNEITTIGNERGYNPFL
jgi:glyoxylase-like metal-dependent hydrolase (beta-lactamase superfamily II)